MNVTIEWEEAAEEPHDPTSHYIKRKRGPLTRVVVDFDSTDTATQRAEVVETLLRLLNEYQQGEKVNQ